MNNGSREASGNACVRFKARFLRSGAILRKRKKKGKKSCVCVSASVFVCTCGVRDNSYFNSGCQGRGESLLAM